MVLVASVVVVPEGNQAALDAAVVVVQDVSLPDRQLLHLHTI